MMKPLLAFLSLASLPAHAQTPPATLNFEVASIKPSLPGRQPVGIGPAPGGVRFEAHDDALIQSLIARAYRVLPDQVMGVPKWIEGDHYDVYARAERPSSPAEHRVMLQNLLADRFQLRVHRGTKELQEYALTVDKNGSRLTASETPCTGAPSVEESFEELHRVKVAAKCIPMDEFAGLLQSVLYRPVADETNLTGNYDLDFIFVEEVPSAVAERLLNSGLPFKPHPTLFEAVQRQFGLQLVFKKAPVEIIVVDSVARPSEN
jgi:uncharacterized protein (TIGR03435 family)